MKITVFITFMLTLTTLLSACGNAVGQGSSQTIATAPKTEISHAEVMTTAPAAQEYDPPASYGEWFLSPITWTQYVYEVTPDKAYENLTLKTPKQVTVARGDLVFTVDFFKESYRCGEGLQVRITVHNSAPTPFVYGQNTGYCLIQKSNESASFCIFRIEQLSYLNHAIPIRDIPAQGEVVFEYLFVIDPSAYKVYTEEGTCRFLFNVISAQDDSPYDHYYVEIPLEIVNGE